MSDSDDIKEAVTRLRRIETRLTRFLTETGHETGARMPFLVMDEIVAPGYHTTLSGLLSTIPADRRAPGAAFDVIIDGAHVATLFPSEADDGA